MTEQIDGLHYADFAPYFAMYAEQLAALNAMRMTADSDGGFPRRISLKETLAGEELILVNYVSQDISNPYRTRYAILSREAALESRLCLAGIANLSICAVFTDPRIACYHVHYAADGCFAARINRHGEGEAS